MYCSSCGKEITDDSTFCGFCGTTVPTAPVQSGPPAAPSVPPPMEAAPVAPTAPAALMQPGPFAPPPRKSALPWVLGALGLVAVAAVVLVLVFVVFNNKSSVGTSGPEQVVRDFYKAIEKQDAAMLLDTTDLSYRSAIKKALGQDYEQYFGDYFFTGFPEDLKVTIRKMDTKIDGDKATVRVVDGTLTYTDENGDKTSEEASAGGGDVMELVKVDGKWYLSADFLTENFLDPSNLEDLGLDGTGGTKTGDAGTGTGKEADQLAELEKATLAYVKANSDPSLEFKIISLAINGNEAVGVVTCTNQYLERPLVIMEKGSGGWYGVNLGTGFDPPSWYDKEMQDVETAMLDYVGTKATPGQTFEITSLLFWGNQAAGIAVCTNRNVDSLLVIMKKGSSGWYGVEQGTDVTRPDWYWPDL